MCPSRASRPTKAVQINFRASSSSFRHFELCYERLRPCQIPVYSDFSLLFPGFISPSYCSFFLVQIFCDVIRGAFDVSSNAGNGHKAQDGGQGADGLDNTEAVISIFFW